MKQVSQHYRTGDLIVGEHPAPALHSGGLVVATQASLVSAGTEKLLIDLARANLAGKALSRPDLVRQVVDKAKREGVLSTIEKVRSKLDTAIPLGYSCAGRVVEVGRDAGSLKVGDRVACAGAGYANHAEYNYVPKNLCVPIPDGVDDEDASFVTLGAIALQGVRRTAPALGERIVVLGLGLLGLLTVQLLKANGCKVLGFDPVPAKCQLGRDLGADMTCHSGLDEAAAEFSASLGADAVIVTASTKDDEPINAAARIARMKGRVVVVGMVGMNIQRDQYYRKELDLRLSMSYGPGRYDPSYEEQGRDYPFAYVRWTERRNMQAFLELVREQRVTPKALITHRVDIGEAAKVYELLAAGKEPYLGMVLTYPKDVAVPPIRRMTLSPKTEHAEPMSGGVGFIGAGNFAKSVLLPHLKKIEGVRLTGVASSSSLTCTGVADKFGFAYATTDYHDLLRDPKTETIFIVTRHASHAPLVCESLQAGKNVFVEKPLAIDRAQLDTVIDSAQASEGRLMVGFNRRFAPFLCEAKRALEDRAAPLVMLYRVNAGVVPGDSWIQGDEGGGRIIGEVCHFIDALQFLAGAPPISVNAMHVEGRPDAVSIQLAFEDGSVGTIVYSSLGDAAFPKERIEVFGAGRVITIDDFQSALFVNDGRRRRRRMVRQDKGFAAELLAFRTSPTAPIPLDELHATTVATFAVEESLHMRAPIAVV